MVNFILYLIILAGGAGTGYLTARKFENRVIHLDDLILTLKTVQAEMEYRNDPLPILLERVGERTKEKAGEFLITVCEILQREEQFDFYESWKRAVLKVYEESALNDEDRQILIKAGIELGKTGIANQLAMFNYIFSGLKRQREEADEERKTKGKVYQTLGIASGALAIIILL